MPEEPAFSSLSGTPLRVRVRLSTPTGPVVPGLPGIVCLGLPAREGFPPLVLVYDEGEDNSGASATNAMGTLLDWLSKAWGSWLPVCEALVVEHDSLGYFDHVLVRRGPNGVDIGWAPLRCPPHPARSEAAWRALGGPGAAQLLAEVRLSPR